MKLKGVTPKKRDKPTGFFHLPVEIRMEIYRLCVPNGYIFDVRENPTFATYRSKLLTRDTLVHWTAMGWIRDMIEASSDESSSSWSGPEYAYASSEWDQGVSEDSEAEESSAEESQEDTDEALDEGSEDDRSTDWNSDSRSSQGFPSGGAMHLFAPSPFERSKDVAFYGTAADQLFYYPGFEYEDGSEEGDSYGEADIYDYDHGSVSYSDSDSKSESEGESGSESESEGNTHLVTSAVHEYDDETESHSNSDSDSESDSESDNHGTSTAEADSSLLDHIKGIPMDKWRDITSLSPNWVPTICGLLLASRQIREEVLDVLYGENVFRVAVGKRSSEMAVRIGFSQSKLQRIRHVMFIYKQFSNCLGTVPEFSIDRRLWDDILPNLTTLHFVAEQPTGDLYHHAEDCLRTVADQMRVWLQELPPTLAYLGRTLSPSASFLVDVDGTKVTSGLIDASLGRKWEHVRTTTGDIVFRRPSTFRHRHHDLDQTFDDAPSYCSCDDSSSSG